MPILSKSMWWVPTVHSLLGKWDDVHLDPSLDLFWDFPNCGQKTDRLHILCGLNITGQKMYYWAPVSCVILADSSESLLELQWQHLKAKFGKNAIPFFLPVWALLFYTAIHLGGFRLDHPVRNTLNNCPRLKMRSFAGWYNLSSQSFSKSWQSHENACSCLLLP